VELRSPKSNETRNQIPYTDPKNVLALYQVMKDVHELFEAYGLRYWIESGTLLGAVRHGGLIPWDSDIDISVELHDKELFLEIAPLLERLNYSVDDTWLFGYQVHSKEAHAWVDIFFWNKEDGRYLYSYEFARGTWPYFEGPAHYRPQDLFPLKKYTFGPLEVWGPHDAYYFLNQYFSNWNTIARFQTVDHVSYTNLVHEITDEDRVPAQPFGPLEDRVAPLLKEVWGQTK